MSDSKPLNRLRPDVREPPGGTGRLPQRLRLPPPSRLARRRPTADRLLLAQLSEDGLRDGCLSDLRILLVTDGLVRALWADKGLTASIAVVTRAAREGQ